MSDTTRNTGRTQAARRADRQDRIDSRSERLRTEAAGRFNAASAAVEGIPFGQPILVGHHSERGHRRALAKHDTNMRKGIALNDAASAVASVTPSTAVLATDSDGAEIMQGRIEKAEAQQAQWKAINALVRKGDRAALAAMGLGETTIKELFTPQWGGVRGPIGLPAYLLSNNNANIRRMRLRLAELQRATKLEFKERTVGDVRVVEDPDTMRIRLYFPGKPSPAVIAILKMHAFRWAPSERAWQRQLTGSGRMHADLVLHAIESAREADMLNELESEQLAAMVDAYGIRGLIDALATEAMKRAARLAPDPRAFAWARDGKALRRVEPQFWTTGG